MSIWENWFGSSPVKIPLYSYELLNDNERVIDRKTRQELIKQVDIKKEVVNTIECGRKVKCPNKLNF